MKLIIRPLPFYLAAATTLAQIPSLAWAQSPASPARPVTAGAVSVAPKSQLPYLSGGDVWVDARGSFPIKTAKTGDGAQVREMRMIVFQPQAENLKWETLVGLYASRGVVAPGARSELDVTQATPDAFGNVWDTRVYKSSRADELVVLGLIQNTNTQHQLAYAVVVAGKLSHAQAVVEANAVVDFHAGEAKRFREAARRSAAPPVTAPAAPAVLIPPVPVGFSPAKPMARLAGPGLAELLQSIERTPTAGSRVREMARVLIPQAKAVTLSQWRTSGIMPDQAFIQFYLQSGAKLGWTSLTLDQTQAGRPTLLFQRPNDEGVVMVRSAPTAPAAIAPGAQPFSTITVLVMDGKINVNSLRKN